MVRQGRPPKIQGEHRAVLAAIVASTPTATLGEIGRELQRRTGIQAHAQTIVSTLRSLGIERVPSQAAVTIERTTEVRRYGYTDAHRRQAPESHPHHRGEQT
jgi:transposase